MVGRIRRFRRGDLGAILRIEANAFPKTAYDRFTFSYFASAYPDNFRVYIAGHEVVGYIIYYPDGHIVSVAVHARYRRMGVGTELVGEVLKRTRGDAIVEVRESNDAARAFYSHLGFVVQGIIPGYYGDEDAVVMLNQFSKEKGFTEKCLRSKLSFTKKV
ncbi:ribosomal-protein-alanine N-acetyltransferase [Methanophagales archaeon]|nr:ribosomal-protein-alanine N-acetyltransferase [Methanophagales archaeon]